MNADYLSVPTAWTRKHTTLVSGLEPDTELDDLEPLREMVGEARVRGDR